MITKEERLGQILKSLSFDDCKNLLKKQGLWSFKYNLATEQQLKEGIYEKALSFSVEQIESFIKKNSIG
jgi:hypothetical protein